MTRHLFSNMTSFIIRSSRCKDHLPKRFPLTKRIGFASFSVTQGLDTPALVDVPDVNEPTPPNTTSGTNSAAKKAPKLSSTNHTTMDDFTHEVAMLDIDGDMRLLHYFDSGYVGEGQSSHNNSGSTGSTSFENETVLVILCGTAQSIPTWSLHTRHFTKTRRVLIPELRSQGRTTSLLLEHCTLSQHVSDLRQFLNRVLNIREDSPDYPQVDLVGFSLGGRIGLSFAEAYPKLVRSVSVTGVPHHRPYLGQLILRSWLQGLQKNGIADTAWSFFKNGVSPKFLQRNQRSMRIMVDNVIQANDSVRLQFLLENALASGALGMDGSGSNTSLDEDPDQEVSVSRGRLRLHCRTQVIASEEDRLAGSGSELRLAKVIDMYHAVEGMKCHYSKISNCGHLAPFERPAEWRKLVLDFLDSAP